MRLKSPGTRASKRKTKDIDEEVSSNSSSRLRYQNVILDLDGTILDSFEGIRNSLAQALQAIGRPPLDINTVKRMIGPPLQEGFRRFCRLTDTETEMAIQVYRHLYRETGLFQSRLYPEIKTTILDLKAFGAQLFVATGKQTESAKKILAFHNISEHFTAVYGADEDAPTHDKSAALKDILERFDIEPESAIMIGDKGSDIFAAHDNSMHSVGVLYGYGTQDEIQTAGPTHTVQSPQDLKKIIELTVPSEV